MSWYGAAFGLVLAVKLVLSILPRRRQAPESSGLTVAAIVPVYNENPEAFRACLRSLLDQSRPLDEIWVIDDGSETTDCMAIAEAMTRGMGHVTCVRLETNAGKRHAMAVALMSTTCDAILTVDSDTIANRDCLELTVAYLDNPKVMAVTAQVRALNFKHNVLTRLIGLRYLNAFLWERAAYSTFGSVLCCCGSFSLYRMSMVREHLDDFVNQKFLGVHVQYGDDRRLTNYALQHGRALIAPEAIAYTLVPERMTHFIRQQVRWNKSFFRETLWSVRHLSWSRPAPWLAALEFVAWLVGSISLIVAVVYRPVFVGEFALHAWIWYLAVLALVRSVRALGQRDVPWYVLGLAPLYGVLHAVLLLPLRFYSLFTLRRGAWGTRSGVEVTFERHTDDGAHHA